jgi:subtilisin family serine protease
MSLVSPSGVHIALPPVGNSKTHETDRALIELGVGVAGSSSSVQTQIFLQFANGFESFDDLRGWSLKITCAQAVVGRIDGWLAGDRLAQFRDGPLLETARTIGMPATSNDVIAVASHASKNSWTSDAGAQAAPAAIVDRSSRFSSRGPTRDGRQKPEISAPGEMITAALAVPSKSARLRSRADTRARQLTIEGTSMATPFTTGVIALMLERKADLAAADIVRILETSAVKDEHTGPTSWTPDYGHGKISAKRALDAMGPPAAPAAVPAASGRSSRPRRQPRKKPKD